MAISKVRKRDGTIVRFRITKIERAVEKAMLAVAIVDEQVPKTIAEKVAAEIGKRGEETQSVEKIQDMIEKVLISEGLAETAKAFILYRQKRAEHRKLKENILGRMDDSNLSVNGLLIAKSRYLKKNRDGNILETPSEMFQRVAKAIARVESNYVKPDSEINKLEEDFLEMLNSLEFLPGGRILAGAGTNHNMLFSSFVIPVKDSMRSIFRALYDKALIQRQGGGTGFSFSKLRPKGEQLTTTAGYASGPIAFIKLFDYASELTTQFGNRRAANMGSLSVEHPDIIEFITMKDRREIRNFNISVEITNAFMEAVKSGKKYQLKDPATGKVLEEVDAGTIFHLIVTMAWKTGDPGILFIDKINASNPMPALGRIETTDPCGDQLLLPYDAGNLGAINLTKFVKKRKIMWKQMARTTRLAVRFLDNALDATSYPIKKVKDMVMGTRRIGLGVMGFADMLYKLEVPYNTDQAVEIAQRVMKHIQDEAFDASHELAKEKGAFPLCEKSLHKRKLRNYSLLAISPTGSRSILAETSSGIEPNFGLGYTRKVLGNTELMQMNRVLESILEEYDLLTPEIKRNIITTGTIEHLDRLPEKYRKVFITAFDISPEWHIKMQAAFQKYVDNAISKTINFSKNATIDDIRRAFLLAYEKECKGITVYRQGSLGDGVIALG